VAYGSRRAGAALHGGVRWRLCVRLELGGSLIAQGTKMDAKTAKWFKIDEAGLYPDKTWASAKLTAQKGQWTFKLPSTLKYARHRCPTDCVGTGLTSCARSSSRCTGRRHPAVLSFIRPASPSRSAAVAPTRLATPSHSGRLLGDVGRARRQRLGRSDELHAACVLAACALS